MSVALIGPMIRQGSHNHRVLAHRMLGAHPHRDDPLVTAIAGALPDYVQSRYSAPGLNRLAVVKLALGVQFLAASAARRVSTRDIASEKERDDWPGARQTGFYL